MPSFEPQYCNGYKLKLHPSGFIRQILSYVYHYRSVYFNGSYINFDLSIGISKNSTLQPIEYEWELYNRETKEMIDSNSGSIIFSKKKRKIKAISDGVNLERFSTWDMFKYKYYLGLRNAVQLGYQVDSIKCYIKMKFTVGDNEYDAKPMAVFNIYDKDEFHRIGIELFIGAFIGGAVAFFLSRIFS